MNDAEWIMKQQLAIKDTEIERLRKELKLVSEDHAMRKEEYVDSRRRWEAEIERMRGLMINLVSSAKARPYFAGWGDEFIVCGDDFNAIKKEVNDE